MAADLSELKKFLPKLDLNPNRIPTVQEYKKAYREKLKLHPDLGGDTAAFQEITEAALFIWQFITRHNEQQTRKNTEKDSELIKVFEAENNVTYNQGSVVFEIKAADAALWIECFKKKIGEPTTLGDGSGVIMKMENFKIPAVSCHSKANYGSLAVTVYPSPKSSNPKVMVQGKMYLAFITFIIPLILQDMKAGQTPALSGPESVKTIAQITGSEVLEEEESEASGTCVNEDYEVINKAFKRMEKEIVSLRDDLVAKVDHALPSKPDQDRISQLETKLDSLETLIKTNTDQVNSLFQTIEKLNIPHKTVAIDNEQLEILGKNLTENLQVSNAEITGSLAALRQEVSTAAELNNVKVQIRDIATVIDDVCTTTHKMDDQVDKLSGTSSVNTKTLTEELNQLRLNSDRSLHVFNSMQRSLESMSQTLTNTSNTSRSNIPTTPDTPSETRNRKGIIFSSSVALDMNKNRFKEELNCDLQIVQTNYIEHHPSSETPEAYLESMVKKHLAGKSEYDFAIIATGSDDISELDTVNSPPTTLYENTTNLAKSLFKTAELLTTDPGIDVFICENPPRYEPISSDPRSMKQNLAKFSNGVIATSVLPAPRIVLIEQTSLARNFERARSEIFQKDGINLSSRGLTIYTNNIIAALQDYYGDIKRSENPGRSGADRARQGDHHQGHDGQRRGGGGDHGQYRSRNRNNNRHRGSYDAPRDNFQQAEWQFRGRGDADHRDWGEQQRGGGGRGDHYWDYHSEGGYRGGYNSYNRQRNSRRY